MRVLLRTKERIYDGDEGAAVLEVVPELVAWLRKLVNLREKLQDEQPSLNELTFWSSPLECYDGHMSADALYDDGYIKEDAYRHWENHGWCVLPDEVDFDSWDEDYTERTEAERLHVCGADGHGICWSWYRKHADPVWESETIGIEDLEKLLATAV
jgi:hypothetical protein